VCEVPRVCIWSCVVRERHQREHFLGAADADEFSVRIGDDDVRFAVDAIDRHTTAAVLPLVGL
jgi:hypothetical protein